MSNPTDLLYLKSHEWVRIEGDEAVFGITDFAQDALGDITYVDLPMVGDKVKMGDEIAAVESVKAASDIYSPVDGEVIEVNEALEDKPEIVNEDAFNKGWIARFKLAKKPEGLLSAKEYEAQAVAE